MAKVEGGFILLDEGEELPPDMRPKHDFALTREQVEDIVRAAIAREMNKR